jgi:hypothetical protein
MLESSSRRGPSTRAHGVAWDARTSPESMGCSIAALVHRPVGVTTLIPPTRAQGGWPAGAQRPRPAGDGARRTERPGAGGPCQHHSEQVGDAAPQRRPIAFPGGRRRLCPGWVERTVGAGARTTEVVAGRWRHAEGDRPRSFCGPARVSSSRLDVAGRSDRWGEPSLDSAAGCRPGVCVGRRLHQHWQSGDDGDHPGVGGADSAGLLAHGRLADRRTRPAGHGPGGPGRPGHHGPRPLPPGPQRARGPPWLPGLRALLAGRYRQRRPQQLLGDQELRFCAGRHHPRRWQGQGLGPDRRGAPGRPPAHQRRPAAAPGHSGAAVDHDLRARQRRLVVGG